MNERRELVGAGLKHEMEMVGHETEAKEFDRIAGFRIGEEGEKGLIVAVFRRAPIAPVEDMVDATAEFVHEKYEASRMRHCDEGKGLNKVACPLFLAVPFFWPVPFFWLSGSMSDIHANNWNHNH